MASTGTDRRYRAPKQHPNLNHCSPLGRRLVNLRRKGTPASQTNHLGLSLIDCSGPYTLFLRNMFPRDFTRLFSASRRAQLTANHVATATHRLPAKRRRRADLKIEHVASTCSLTPKAGWALVYLCLRHDQLLPTFNIASISSARTLSNLSRTFANMGSPRTAIPVIFGSMTIGKPGKFTLIADFSIKYGTKFFFH